MAHEEVRLLRAGCMDLNKALSKFMAGRSFHSVKSHRRQQSYRDLVRAYVPTTGGLGAQEVAIPPRLAARGSGGAAPRPRAGPREEEMGQPLRRPAPRGAEADPPRSHSPPHNEPNEPPADAVEAAFGMPTPQEVDELPVTCGIDTPTRAVVDPTHGRENYTGAEYDWIIIIIIIIIIIVTSFAPISSKIKLSGATKPGD